MIFWFPYLLVYWLTGSMISDLLCYVDYVTPVSAETVYRPNTTTPFTSSAFSGIRPYTSIQPP